MALPLKPEVHHPRSAQDCVCKSMTTSPPQHALFHLYVPWAPKETLAHGHCMHQQPWSGHSPHIHGTGSGLLCLWLAASIISHEKLQGHRNK